MVQVGVRDDDRVERTEGQDLGGVQVRRSVVFGDEDAAVDEDLRLPRAQEGRGTADLAESPERRDPHVVLALRDFPCESAAYLVQQRLAFVIDRAQVLARLFDGAVRK